MNAKSKALVVSNPTPDVSFSAPVAYNDWYKHNDLPREAHLVMPGGPSMTRQEFAEECDLNNIMARYESYMTNPMRSVQEPVYYDFTTAPSTLMEFMDIQFQAETAFMSLPASVRRDFDNDPMQFVQFASDPANLGKMREYGLAKPVEEAAKPLKVEVVPPAASAAGAQATSAPRGSGGGSSSPSSPEPPKAA